MSIIVYTVVSPDGVIGLNGRHYLLDDHNEVFKFESLQEAKEFVHIIGQDPEEEYINYIEVDEDGNEYDIDHDGERLDNA